MEDVSDHILSRKCPHLAKDEKGEPLVEKQDFE